MLKTILIVILGLAVVLSQRNSCIEISSSNVLVDIKDAQLQGTQRTQGIFSNQAIEVGNNKSAKFSTKTFGGDLSIKFSLYLNEHKPHARIVDFCRYTTTDIVKVGIDGDNKIYTKITVGYSTYLTLTADLVDLHSWMHFVFTFGPSTVKVYKNGSDVTSSFSGFNIYSSIPFKTREVMDIAIGLGEGKLDELVIYERVIPQEEIDCLFDTCQSCTKCRQQSSNCDGSTPPPDPTPTPSPSSRNCDISEIPIFKDDTYVAFKNGAQRVQGKFSDRAIDCNSANQQYADLHFSDLGRKTFTVSFWAFPRSVTHFGRIIELGNGPDSDNIVISRAASSSGLQMDVRDGNKRILARHVNNAIIDNEWHHYSVVVDFPSIKFFRDGAELTNENSSLHDSSYTEIPDVARGQNYMCRSSWNGDGYFDGIIEDLKIYSQSISNTNEQECLADKCTQYCDSCKNQSDNCLNCQANRVVPSCGCPQSHRDIGQASCEATASCACPPNFESDPNSPGVCKCPISYDSCPSTFDPINCSC